MEKLENNLQCDMYRKAIHDMGNCLKKLCTRKRDGGLKEDFEDIFGIEFSLDIFRDFSGEEIITKIEEWEKEKKDRVDVGDVISVGCDGLRLLVTSVDIKNDQYQGISYDGVVYTYPRNSDYITKKDRHIDLWEIFEKITS